MYVIGAGRTKFGKLDKSLNELMYESVSKALIDAKLKVEDIDAMVVSNALADLTHSQLHLNSILATLLHINIPIIRVESTCASGGAAFYNGLLHLNKFKTVLVVGAEKMSDCPNLELSNYIGRSSDFELDQKEGFIFPAGAALLIERFEKKNGNVMDALAAISLKNHENANKNQLAHFFEKKVNIEQIKNSPVVCGKLRLFDCSPTSDGAVAMVLSKEKKDQRSIKVAACELATGNVSICFEHGYSFPAQRIAVEKALSSAGMKQSDIEMIEIHDGYTIVELLGMVDLGFYDEKSAIRAVMEGETMLNGKIPVNTDGGLKGNGHPIGATGLAQIYEAITQLRKEAGERQVNARTAMTHNIGGMVGSCVVSIFKSD